MECAKIRERFSEYVDGCLQDQDKADVEKHLSTCENCRNELASVKALVQELGSLYSVKAPSDFLENIHKRLAPEPAEQPAAASRLERILRKLFIPWRIKIPWELAAAAAVVILVFGVYYVELPQKPEATFPKAAPQAMRQEAPAIPMPKKETVKSESFFDESETAPTTGTRAPVELALLLRHDTSRKSVPSAGGAAQPLSPAPEKAAEPAPTIMGSTQETQKHRGQTSDQTAPQAVPSTCTPPVDESASLEFTEDEEIRSQILDLVTAAGGTFLPPQQVEMDAPMSIYAEIPSEQYTFFCLQLENLGTFQSPPPQLPKTDQQTVSVLIRLIPPE